jgi:hypothetical protein
MQTPVITVAMVEVQQHPPKTLTMALTTWVTSAPGMQKDENSIT